jgi:hypothetical protein
MIYFLLFHEVIATAHNQSFLLIKTDTESEYRRSDASDEDTLTHSVSLPNMLA